MNLGESTFTERVTSRRQGLRGVAGAVGGGAGSCAGEVAAGFDTMLDEKKDKAQKTGLVMQRSQPAGWLYATVPWTRLLPCGQLIQSARGAGPTKRAPRSCARERQQHKDARSELGVCEIRIICAEMNSVTLA